MENRIVFQVNKTAFRNQKMLWYKFNAVHTQIWITVCIHLLVANMKKILKLKQELYTILQILSVCIFEKVPVNHLFENKNYKNNTTEGDNQLIMFDL